MSKPPLFAMPHHIGIRQVKSKTLEIITESSMAVKIYTASSILQRYSTHTFHPHTVLSTDYANFQPSLIMSQPHKFTWSGHMLYLSCPLCYMMTKDCQDGRYLLELSPSTGAHLILALTTQSSIKVRYASWTIEVFFVKRQVITDPHL